MNEQELIQKLFMALTSGEPFSAEVNGFKISADKKDNTISIDVTNMLDNAAIKERNEFEKWVSTLPDHVFLAVCEDLATDKLAQIQDCLNSEDIDSVRSAILRFKQAVRNYVTSKIDEITEKANQEINYYNSFIND